MCLTIKSTNLVLTAYEVSRNPATTWTYCPPGAVLTSSASGRKENVVLRARLPRGGSRECL